MKKQNLTARRVKRLLKKAGRYRDNDVKGLLLCVVGPGSASWQLRYQKNGRERWHGLGPVALIPLKDARKRARAARLQLLDGQDPIDARRKAKADATAKAAKAITFAAAAGKYFDSHADKWRSRKHRDQFMSTLRMYAFPVIGAMEVAAVDTTAVLRCLDPIWKDKTVTADRTRNRIESVLDWATVRGYRSGDNPARWKGHLREVLPTTKAKQPKHYAALPYGELPGFLAALRKREGVAARALEFTILTAARTGEVCGAQWSEIDFATATWTVPAHRIKGGKEHRVPLSDAAIKLLKSLPTMKGTDAVFIGNRDNCLSTSAMSAVLGRVGQDDITVHGFRSTFRDWAAERTNYQNHIVEMALAHSIPSGVEKAYRRGDLFDKRRKLMMEWAKYCTEIKPVAGKIIPLKKAVS